jgi:hypothetical protein
MLAFFANILEPKIYKTKKIKRKAAQFTLVQRHERKMLMRLTPGFQVENRFSGCILARYVETNFFVVSCFDVDSDCRFEDQKMKVIITVVVIIKQLLDTLLVHCERGKY